MPYPIDQIIQTSLITDCHIVAIRTENTSKKTTQLKNCNWVALRRNGRQLSNYMIRYAASIFYFLNLYHICDEAT